MPGLEFISVYMQVWFFFKYRTMCTMLENIITITLVSSASICYPTKIQNIAYFISSLSIDIKNPEKFPKNFSKKNFQNVQKKKFPFFESMFHDMQKFAKRNLDFFFVG